MMFQTFEHAGLKLSYVVRGRGEPLVLIHGLSGSTRWWRHNLPVLALHYRVYVLDLVGYGSARGQRAVGLERDVALLVAWLEHLDLQGVNLVGHSMGGHIALRVAERQPERVGSLVLVCASGLLAGHPARLVWRLPLAGWRGRRSFLPRVLLDSARAGLPNLWRSGVSVLRDDVQPSLGGVQARTLVVWGERDVLIPSEQGRRLAAGLRAQYVELRAAGHIPMVETPAAFNRVLLTFLNQGHHSK